jgi:hypothetical protein
MQKCALLVIIFIGLLMMIPLPPAGATCVPTGLNLGDRFQGCPSLQKIGTWNVLFPCSSSPAHDALIEINGTGQCGSGTVCCDTTPRTTECWPLFNAPVATDNKWRVVVNNRNANTSTTSCTGGCAAATTITCVTVWSQAFEVLHSGGCNHSGGGGGGCPDGQFPPECDPGQSIDFENCCCVAYDGGPCLSSPVLVDVFG